MPECLKDSGCQGSSQKQINQFGDDIIITMLVVKPSVADFRSIASTIMFEFYEETNSERI